MFWVVSEWPQIRVPPGFGVSCGEGDFRIERADDEAAAYQRRGRLEKIPASHSCFSCRLDAAGFRPLWITFRGSRPADRRCRSRASCYWPPSRSGPFLPRLCGRRPSSGPARRPCQTAKVGRRVATPSSRSSAMPRLSIGPSWKSRPQSEMPCGTVKVLPVAALFRDRQLAGPDGRHLAGVKLLEAGAQMQARMPGAIAGDQHRPGLERTDQRIDLGEQLVERHHRLVAQPVELHVVDRRQEARAAEDVRPGALVLPGQRVVGIGERQLLERRPRPRRSRR